MKNNILKLFIISLMGISCQNDDVDLFDPNTIRNPININTNTTFADPNLNQEAKDLYSKLQLITQQGIAFGQQGTGAIDINSDKSDFRKVAKEWPAIIGFDLEGLDLRDPLNPDPAIVKDCRKESILEAHKNGSIITISWHAANPISKRNSFDRTKVVHEMLEGGSQRLTFITYLERLALFLNSLKDTNGRPIPILFRPWHEMNGDFFYWGEGLRTTAEFKQLYKDTVTILTEKFNVHNLIYVYSPNKVSSSGEYLKNYPGDNYVDILGIDVYDHRNNKFLQDALQSLNIVENIANEKNMLFALTETGLENITQHDWWTENLYKAIRSSNISYAMIWRNATEDHFFTPFIGHPSENNFKEFISKKVILLQSDIQ